MGMLHVTALRLADIFSDDSNFRNLVMDKIVREYLARYHILSKLQP